MTHRFHKLLPAVSVLPALLVMPAVADPVLDGSRIVVEPGTELVITPSDNVVFQNLNFTGNGGAAYNSGTLTIGGASFEHNTATGNSGAIAQHNTASVLNLTDVDFIQNSADWGGAIVARGTVDITGGEFDGNTSNDGGGAIYLATLANKGHQLDINGTSFINNSTAGVTVDGGGAIASFSDLVVSNATFTGNSAQGTGDGGAGGAVIMGSVSTNEINNTTFSNNTAATSGGAIGTRNFFLGDNNEATLDIVGGGFTENTAATTGGAIDNHFYNDAADDGYVKVSGSTFLSNSAASGGAVYNHVGMIGDNLIDALHNGKQTAESDPALIQVGNMYLTGVTFTGNTASETGGAIYNQGVMTIDDTTFTDNVVTDQGGAIYNYGSLNIDGAVFTGNHTTSSAWPSQGGAIYNAADDEYLDLAPAALNISNTVFGNENDAASGNSALQGGAIANNGDYVDGTVTLTNVNFYNNKAFADLDDSDGYSSSLGGAIWNAGLMTVNGNTMFKNNSAEGYNVEGGAIYNLKNMTFNDAVIFDSNVANATDFSGNGAFGGAVYNTRNMTFADMATFSNNRAINAVEPTLPIENKYSQGGALHNSGTVTMASGALFVGNRADLGGGIYNTGTVDMTDVVFTDNIADQRGAAIYNKGTVNISALNEDVIFHNNTVNGQVYDIYNSGVLNFNAGATKSISLEGVQGNGTINKTGDGVLTISEYAARHTINVDEGELHLTTGVDNLYQSNVYVASGATINTIDNLINDYASSIMLSDGAMVKGDLDYTNGLADLYSADDGATIIYSMANPLDIGVQYGASKTIRVVDGEDVTVNAGTGFAWFDSDHGLTLTSSGNADGSVVVTGTVGGINAAVGAADASAGVHQEIAYVVTEDEVFDGAHNVIQEADFAITGNGADGNVLTLADNLIVDTGSSLTITDAALAQATSSEKIQNKFGAVLNIKNSSVGIEIDNAGILMSDPTTYSGVINNTGAASFAGDIFESSAVLNNSSAVALAEDELGNSVIFNSGASITGTGVIDLVSGTTQFNNTASSNTINLANGADFSGVLASTGTLNTQNGHIDTVTGSVTGGTLKLDASLIGAGAVDTFADATGAEINAINLIASEYGNASSLTVNLNGATLADNFVVTGATNYYTDVAVDSESGNLVFSDKLLNTSGFYTLADATWSGGEYIKSAATYDTPADANHLTIGGALAALDSAIVNLHEIGAGNENNGAHVMVSDGTNKTAEMAAATTLADGYYVNMIKTDATAHRTGLSADYFADAGDDDPTNSAIISLTVGNDTAHTSTVDISGDVVNIAGATAITGNTTVNGTLSAGATTVSSLTVGGTTVDGIDTTVTTDSGNLITSGAVATALGGKQDAITSSNKLDAGLIATDSTHQFVTNDQITAWGNKQDAITSTNKLDASLIATDTTHQFVTNDQITSWNNKQDAITVDNKLDASLISGLSAAATASIDTTVTADSGNLITSGAVATALGGKQDAITSSNKLDAGLIATDSTHQFVTNDQIDAWNALVGTGSIAEQIKDGAETGTYTANATSHVAGTIGAAIDDINSTMGTVHGLVASGDAVKTTTNKDYHGNLAVGTTVEDHLVALDTAIGDMRGFAATDGTGNNYAVYDNVADNLTALDSKISALSLNIANRDTLALTAAKDYTDNRVETLDRNLSSGIASAVALSSVAVGGVRRGEMSVGAGYGYFNGQSAAAFGAAVGLSSRWSVNAGAGVSGYDVSFRAGTNFKFKVF